MGQVLDIQLQAKQVQERIHQLQQQGANMTPAWKAVGANVVNRIRLGFRFSKSPWGQSWIPIKWRAARTTQTGRLSGTGRKQSKANTIGHAGQPLVDTGKMRRSIVARASTSGVTIGTNIIQARVHQFGATIKPKKGPFLVFAGPSGGMIFARQSTVPARPYMPISPSGALDLPPSWAASIIGVLAAHFNLSGRDLRFTGNA